MRKGYILYSLNRLAERMALDGWQLSHVEGDNLAQFVKFIGYTENGEEIQITCYRRFLAKGDK